MTKKKKPVIKRPKPLLTKKMLHAMTAEELAVVRVELNELLQSRGWLRLVSIIHNEVLKNLNARLENHPYKDINEFNRERDTKQVYLKIIGLPELYDKLLSREKDEMNFDPYHDIKPRKR